MSNDTLEWICDFMYGAVLVLGVVVTTFGLVLVGSVLPPGALLIAITIIACIAVGMLVANHRRDDRRARAAIEGEGK